MPVLSPPVTPNALVDDLLRERGFAVLDAAGLSQWLGTEPARLDDWRAFWDDLPPDRYLRDGGHYRRRRHSCFIVDAGVATRVPQRAHWQPVEYNALHGGIERWFEPMDLDWVAQPLWSTLLVRLGERASALRGARTWFVEAHPFRIDTAQGIGRPTPEGAHRDGVDLVAVVLVSRHGVKGGETRVFEAAGPHGIRFTMSEPWTALLLDDERVVHETTPIQPLVEGEPGWRDTLVLTFRSGRFQGPAA
jgi:hypothetical protein